VSSSVAGQLGAFDLAVGGSGSASVVWSTTDGGKSWVEESHLAGETWSAPVRVGRGTMPVTTIDGSGVTTLAWTHKGVRVARRTAHGPDWTGPTLVARQPAGQHFTQLQLTSNSSGDVAIAWQAYVGGKDRVMAVARPHRSASWTAPITLDTMLYVNSARLVIDGSGNALAMWSGTADQNQDYGNYVNWARSTPHGQWSTRRPLPDAITGEDGALVDVSMNADGFAVASWLRIEGGSDGESSLWAARFSESGTWSAPARVSPGLQEWFDVRPWMDDAGVAHLIASRWTGPVRAFSQEPNGVWKGSTLNHDGLIDAKGSGSRLMMVFYRKHALRSRVLDAR
jgi:hypothetical protein